MITRAYPLIVYDTATSVDNTKNVIDPANPATYPSGTSSNAPWRHVIRSGVNNASAVYIGNKFYLTANHVGVDDTGLIIQGTSYNRDTTFAPVAITLPGSPSNTVVDLKVLKLATDPGLPVLPLAGATTGDTNKASVLVGCGLGKGSIIDGQGWNWGANSTRALRWGTNTTRPSAYSNGSYIVLITDFNADQDVNKCQGTLGDSGSAMFQSFSRVWTLSGITTGVSTSNAAKYAPTADYTVAVRLREYSWVLRFDHWKAKYGIAPATTDTSDDDSDGVPLLLEYALGLDPTKPATAGLPTITSEGDKLAITFNRLASVTDIKLEVETSETMETGSWVVEPVIITKLQETTVFQKVKTTVLPGVSGSKFIRLKATRL